MNHDNTRKRANVHKITTTASGKAFCHICKVRLLPQSDKMLLCPNCGEKVFPLQAKHEIRIVPADQKKLLLKQAVQLGAGSRSRKTAINPDDKQDVVEFGYQIEYAEEIN